MTLKEFANQHKISLKCEVTYNNVRVTFRNSHIKIDKTPNILQECHGEGKTEDEAIYNYTYKIRGKQLVINYDDYKTRKDLKIPLSLKFEGKI